MEKEPKDMTTEELKAFIREIMRQESKELFDKELFMFKKKLKLAKYTDIEFDKIYGNKIGTSSSEKIGFFGVTPVDQPATIADPSGGGVAGVDSPARAGVNAIIDRLQELGLISST